MTEHQIRNLVAHLFTFNTIACFFGTILFLELSEPWANWDILLLFAIGMLAPVSYCKLLPYSKWLSGRLLDFIGKTHL